MSNHLRLNISPELTNLVQQSKPKTTSGSGNSATASSTTSTSSLDSSTSSLTSSHSSYSLGYDNSDQQGFSTKKSDFYSYGSSGPASVSGESSEALNMSPQDVYLGERRDPVSQLHGTSHANSSSSNNNNNNFLFYSTNTEIHGYSIDWNKDFQDLLLLPEEDLDQRYEKYRELSSLSKNFLHAAITYGKIIIEEAFIDVKHKTIKPTLVGGQAGGVKYVYNGILFKFALDWIQIYRGDEYSMKAGGHELKSVMRYYGCDGIHVPLMVVLDHRGFRLVAMSILPITKQSIVYGSSDGGKSIHASNPDLNEKMRSAAEKMNIKGHVAGIGSAEKEFIYGPTDIEGHMGWDNLFYVLDCARVFPPTADRSIEESFLYRLFRPEFVQTYQTALSSDACSPFGNVDQETAKINNEEVKQATEYLYHELIPKFAQWMDEHQNSIDWNGQLTEIIHREGINIRYLGLIRNHLTDESLKSLLLSEIIARTFKNLLRQKLREKMKELKSIEADSYIQVIIDFFNIILGDPVEKSSKLWFKDLTVEIKKRFIIIDTESFEEDLKRFSKNSTQHIYYIFQRIQIMTGIKLGKISTKELKKDPVSFRVVESDIIAMDVRVKHMNIISLAEGNALSLQCMKLQGKPGSQRLFKLATNKFEEAIRSTPDNKDILNEYATVLKELAVNVGASKDEILQYLERSFNNYFLAGNYQSLLSLGTLLYQLSKDSRLWVSKFEILQLSEKSLLSIINNNHTHQVLSLLCQSLLQLIELCRYKSELLGNQLPEFQKSGQYLKELLSLIYNNHSSTNSPHLMKQFNENLLNLTNLELSIYLNFFYSKDSKFELINSKSLSLNPTENNNNLFNYLSNPLEFIKFLSKHHQFERIDFSFCQNLTRESYLIISDHFSHLKKLNLSSTEINDQLFFDIISNTSNNSTLKSLNISNCFYLSSISIVQVLKRFQNLSKLKCKKIYLQDYDFLQAIEPMVCPKLKCLNLSSTNLKSIEPFKKIFPNLVHLNFSNCPLISNTELNNYLHHSSNQNQFKKLNFSGCSGLVDDSFSKILSACSPSIEKLNLNTCKISNQPIISFQPNRLSHLNLSNCKINRISKDQNFEILSNLRYLNLSYTNFNCNIIFLILNHSNHHLETLIFNQDSNNSNNNQINTNFNRSNHLNLDKIPNLKVLELNNNNLQIDSLKLLVSKCINLNRLYISKQMDMDMELIKILCELKHLEALDISNCKFINDQVLEFFITQSSCRVILKELNLSGCHLITDVSVELISEQLHQLKKLHLRKCPLISNLSCINLSNSCNLTDLDLSICEMVIESTLFGIFELPSLKNLNLYGCKRITDETLRKILESTNQNFSTVILGWNKTSNPAIELLKSQKPTIQFIINNNVPVSGNSSSGSTGSSSAISTSNEMQFSPLSKPDQQNQKLDLLPISSSTNSLNQSSIISPNSSNSSISISSSSLSSSTNLSNSTQSTAEILPSTLKSLMADLKYIKHNPIPLVSAEPIDGNILIWHANIIPPDGSPYEGGLFHIELKFPPSYPINPPSGVLLTPFPHPHIHDGGRICLDILSDFQSYFQGHQQSNSKSSGWSSAYSVQTILLQIQTFLISLDDEENANQPLSEYLLKIPKAIESSKSFKCSSCPHDASNNIWPPFPSKDAKSVEMERKLALENSNLDITIKSSSQSIPQDQTTEKSLTSSTSPLKSNLLTSSSSLENLNYLPYSDSDLVCYHSRVSYKEDILGIGIGLTMRKNKIEEVKASLDLLSITAFSQGVRSSILKDQFTHWIPLYLNSEHGEKAWPLLESSIIDIFRSHTFSPTLACTFICKAMNTIIVQIMNGTLHASIKLLEGYCSFHQLFLILVKKYPQLLTDINKIIYDFIHIPDKRNKKHTPALGEFLPLLTVSDYRWSEVSHAYLDENFARNVYWLIKAYPELAETEPNPMIDQNRCQHSFDGTLVSIRLLMFHVYFLQNVSRPDGSSLDQISQQYQNLLGRPPVTVRDNLQKAVKDIMKVTTWNEFFVKINVPSVDPESLVIWLRNSVKSSQEKKYHIIPKSNLNITFQKLLKNQNQNENEKSQNDLNNNIPTPTKSPRRSNSPNVEYLENSNLYSIAEDKFITDGSDINQTKQSNQVGWNSNKNYQISQNEINYQYSNKSYPPLPGKNISQEKNNNQSNGNNNNNNNTYANNTNNNNDFSPRFATTEPPKSKPPLQTLPSRQQMQPKPVPLCKYYPLGKCIKGDKCKMSHDIPVQEYQTYYYYPSQNYYYPNNNYYQNQNNNYYQNQNNNYYQNQNNNYYQNQNNNYYQNNNNNYQNNNNDNNNYQNKNPYNR